MSLGLVLMALLTPAPGELPPPPPVPVMLAPEPVATVIRDPFGPSRPRERRRPMAPARPDLADPFESAGRVRAPAPGRAWSSRVRDPFVSRGLERWERAGPEHRREKVRDPWRSEGGSGP